MRRLLGVLLIAGLALSVPAQDRSKKAYELMYEDIQALKLQTQRIEKRLDQSADSLKALTDLVRGLIVQFGDYQKFLASSQESQKGVPGQVQAIQEQLSQIEARLLQMSEDIVALKAQPAATPPGPGSEEAKPPAKTKPGQKSPPAKKTEPPAEEKPVPPPSGLTAKETFDAAMADFSKGNYDLALEGFTLYRQQFPTDAAGNPNPLLDDALYMIGECRYSQKKYAAAVEAFDQLLLDYPVSGKSAAALLKKGFALVEMKKKTEAIAALQLLRRKYPLEEEAKQAADKLKELQEIK